MVAPRALGQRVSRWRARGDGRAYSCRHVNRNYLTPCDGVSGRERSAPLLDGRRCRGKLGVSVRKDTPVRRGETQFANDSGLLVRPLTARRLRVRRPSRCRLSISVARCATTGTAARPTFDAENRPTETVFNNIEPGMCVSCDGVARNVVSSRVVDSERLAADSKGVGCPALRPSGCGKLRFDGVKRVFLRRFETVLTHK